MPTPATHCAIPPPLRSQSAPDHGHSLRSCLRRWLVGGFAAAITTTAAIAAEIPRVIFDTDITGDVDDVLALAMCHTLADRNACEFLGVTISKIDPLTGAFVDAVNTFYARPTLPIGITRKAQIRPSRYLKLVEQRDDGVFRYPHDLLRNEDAPDAVALLRQTLAAQPDRSVSIVQVGLAVNVLGLLRSPADEHSSLSGPELIRRKIKLLSVMAGSFQTINHGNHFLEANVINDIPAMQELARDWPDEVPIVWSGYEIGAAITYPAASIAHDFGYVTRHPVKEAYLLYNGPQHERPTWDLSSVLYAVYPERGYFEVSPRGRVTVEKDGFTRFTPGENGRDRFLILNPLQASRVREAYVQLVTQPPRSQSNRAASAP